MSLKGTNGTQGHTLLAQGLPRALNEEPPANRKCLEDRTPPRGAQPQPNDPFRDPAWRGTPVPLLANRAPKPERDQGRPPGPPRSTAPHLGQAGAQQSPGQWEVGGLAEPRPANLKQCILLYPKPETPSTSRNKLHNSRNRTISDPVALES